MTHVESKEMNKRILIILLVAFIEYFCTAPFQDYLFDIIFGPFNMGLHSKIILYTDNGANYIIFGVCGAYIGDAIISNKRMLLYSSGLIFLAYVMFIPVLFNSVSYLARQQFFQVALFILGIGIGSFRSNIYSLLVRQYPTSGKGLFNLILLFNLVRTLPDLFFDGRRTWIAGLLGKNFLLVIIILIVVVVLVSILIYKYFYTPVISAALIHPGKTKKWKKFIPVIVIVGLVYFIETTIDFEKIRVYYAFSLIFLGCLLLIWSKNRSLLPLFFIQIVYYFFSDQVYWLLSLNPSIGPEPFTFTVIIISTIFLFGGFYYYSKGVYASIYIRLLGAILLLAVTLLLVGLLFPNKQLGEESNNLRILGFLILASLSYVSFAPSVGTIIYRKSYPPYTTLAFGLFYVSEQMGNELNFITNKYNPALNPSPINIFGIPLNSPAQFYIISSFALVLLAFYLLSKWNKNIFNEK
jgi:hypothetical protein